MKTKHNRITLSSVVGLALFCIGAMGFAQAASGNATDDRLAELRGGELEICLGLDNCSDVTRAHDNCGEGNWTSCSACPSTKDCLQDADDCDPDENVRYCIPYVLERCSTNVATCGHAENAGECNVSSVVTQIPACPGGSGYTCTGGNCGSGPSGSYACTTKLCP